jgi:hypothetical protein
MLPVVAAGLSRSAMGVIHSYGVGLLSRMATLAHTTALSSHDNERLSSNGVISMVLRPPASRFDGAERVTAAPSIW